MTIILFPTSSFNHLTEDAFSVPPSRVITNVCSRYLALSFTIIGTLVDLFPEMVLLTEIIMHPGVLSSPSASGTLLRLIFSDGKPVVVFAGTDPEEDDAPMPESLLLVRNSLRRRLSSIAAGLFLKDGCMADRSPRWTYAGLVGVLVGGELLTAIGSSLFLRIEFGWPALVSLLASLLALMISLRSHMRQLGEKPLHQCDHSPTDNGGCFYEFLLPGPLTFARYLMIVPVWPMLLVYAENANFWPFISTTRGDHSLPPSDSAMWVNPRDWFRVAVPELSISDNDSPLKYVYWAILPHLIWALVTSIWTVVSGVMRFVCWYVGYGEDWSRHSSGVYFASQESPFHVWSRRLQGALGLGFTTWVCKDLKRLFALTAGVLFLSFQGYRSGMCMEQEWAFLFSHMAWWIALLIGHFARRKNIFKPSDVRIGIAESV